MYSDSSAPLYGSERFPAPVRVAATGPLEDDVDHQLLRQALGRLPEREKQIVCMRFGLGGRQEKTQKEVADIMGISQSYISRLEKRIMLRLRREISRQIYS